MSHFFLFKTCKNENFSDIIIGRKKYKVLANGNFSFQPAFFFIYSFAKRKKVGRRKGDRGYPDTISDFPHQRGHMVRKPYNNQIGTVTAIY